MGGSSQDRRAPGNPEEYHEVVDPLNGSISFLVDAAFLEISGDRVPAADSIAMAQLAHEDKIVAVDGLTTPITDAQVAARQYIAAASDHVRALCTLYGSAPPVVYGDRILLRAAIEACARSTWLTAAADQRERTRRIANERLASIVDHLEFSKARGPDSTDATDALRKRRDHLAAACADGGLGSLGRKDGEVWVGSKRKGPTSIIKWFADRIVDLQEPGVKVGAMLQRQYSGYTHSSLWALTSALATEAGEASSIMPGTAIAPLAARADIAVRCLYVGSAALVHAVDPLREYMGWTGTDWLDARDATAEIFDRYNLP